MSAILNEADFSQTTQTLLSNTKSSNRILSNSSKLARTKPMFVNRTDCRDSFYCQCAPININAIVINADSLSKMVEMSGFYQLHQNIIKTLAHTKVINPFELLNQHTQKTRHTAQTLDKISSSRKLPSGGLHSTDFVYSLKAITDLVVNKVNTVTTVVERQDNACCGGDKSVNRLSCVLQRAQDLHAHYYANEYECAGGHSDQCNADHANNVGLIDDQTGHMPVHSSTSLMTEFTKSGEPTIANRLSGVVAAVSLRSEVTNVDATKRTFIPPSPVFSFIHRYAKLAELAEYTNQLLYWDTSLCIHLNRYSNNDAVAMFFKTISRLGDGWFWYSMLIIASIMGGVASWHAIMAIILTSLLGVVLYKILKVKTVRPRPYQVHQVIHLGERPLDVFSFPSGHTLQAVLFTLTIGGFFPVLLWLMVPFALLVGLSRMILGLHYPTDVLIGAILGIVLSFLAPELAGLLQMYF